MTDEIKSIVGDVDLVGAENYYRLSFGNLQHGAVYQDAMKSIDRRDEIKAALTTETNLFAVGLYSVFL